jgi:hypothetical protein
MQFSAEDFLDDGDDVDDKTGLLSGQIAEEVEDDRSNAPLRDGDLLPTNVSDQER